MTATLRASNFMKLVDWLNSSEMLYFVAWGYEGLPEQLSGGDVDMCVHRQNYGYVARYLELAGYRSARCPYFDGWHMHEQFSKPDSHSIDLFTSLCFAFMGRPVYMTAELDELFRSRIKRGQIFVASPLAEMLFSCIRFISGRVEPNIVERIIKYVGDAKT